MSGEAKTRVAVLGATGYGGALVVSDLLSHPFVEVTYAGSNSSAGKPLAETCPWLEGLTDLICGPQEAERACEVADVIVMAAPKGVAMGWAPLCLERGKRAIDLSGDFRFHDPKVYEKWYGGTHSAPDLCAEAIYGMAELWPEEVAGARLVANPGCYPTGAILGLYPLLAGGLIEPEGIIVDAKSGVSGAGRAKHDLMYHFPEMNETATAYRIGGHQHTPEIEMALRRAAGREIVLTFTPQLIPLTRGILETIYVRPLTSGAEVLREALAEAYRGRPWVRVLGKGRYPSTKATTGSNFCDLNAFDDARTGRVVLVAAFDNLGRGQAHMAVQNLNLMLGLDERLGIPLAPTFP